MPTSFTAYQGKGFWCQDSYLETWLRFLVVEISKDPDNPDWLLEAKEKWWYYATAGFVGTINMGLDRVIAQSDERRTALMQLASRVNELIRREFGDQIPKEVLNEFERKGNYWRESQTSSNFIKVGIMLQGRGTFRDNKRILNAKAEHEEEERHKRWEEYEARQMEEKQGKPDMQPKKRAKK